MEKIKAIVVILLVVMSVTSMILNIITVRVLSEDLSERNKLEPATKLLIIHTLITNAVAITLFELTTIIDKL